MKLFIKPSAVFLHRDFVDFRKSINGLAAIVEDELNRDAYTGELFVFCNKARDKVKVVYWDQSGFCLWYKRLEKERFKWPRKSQNTIINLSEDQWQWLLSGYDIEGHQSLQFASYSG